MSMDDELMNKLLCSICGGSSFRKQQVLWPDLISEWEISKFESDYIDEQQGCHCLSCGANLRIIALGNAIRSVIPTTATLYHAVHRGELDRLHVLDCNGAEGLSQILSQLPHYQRADYPEYDMQRLPFPDGSFDLVIHSDTLEHIENPLLALEECRRVLSGAGHLCFTVPVIHGRMTRSRAGLRPSYHGAPGSAKEDFLVHTEFGADVWTYLLRAGFDCVTVNHVAFPAATALTAKMSPPLPDLVENG
jgi:SAM-dependent methyltransferase